MSTYAIFTTLLKTGDREDNGTNADVSIQIIGENNETCPIILDNIWRNDFEEGQTDVFN